jgi:hypothetical protein
MTRPGRSVKCYYVAWSGWQLRASSDCQHVTSAGLLGRTRVSVLTACPAREQCYKEWSQFHAQPKLYKGRFTHSMPCPCHAAKGLECVFPIWFTQCGRVWFTLDMPRPCHALTMPFFSRPRHSSAVERRPVGYLPAFGFSRLPRGVPRRLLSEAYQSSQRSIPMTVKSGSSALRKGQSVKLLG